MTILNIGALICYALVVTCQILSFTVPMRRLNFHYHNCQIISHLSIVAALLAVIRFPDIMGIILAAIWIWAAILWHKNAMRTLAEIEEINNVKEEVNDFFQQYHEGEEEKKRKQEDEKEKTK